MPESNESGRRQHRRQPIHSVQRAPRNLRSRGSAAAASTLHARRRGRRPRRATSRPSTPIANDATVLPRSSSCRGPERCEPYHWPRRRAAPSAGIPITTGSIAERMYSLFRFRAVDLHTAAFAGTDSKAMSSVPAPGGAEELSGWAPAAYRRPVHRDHRSAIQNLAPIPRCTVRDLDIRRSSITTIRTCFKTDFLTTSWIIESGSSTRGIGAQDSGCRRDGLDETGRRISRRRPA